MCVCVCVCVCKQGKFAKNDSVEGSNLLSSAFSVLVCEGCIKYLLPYLKRPRYTISHTARSWQASAEITASYEDPF
jgi:hypothetical protein